MHACEAQFGLLSIFVSDHSVDDVVSSFFQYDNNASVISDFQIVNRHGVYVPRISICNMH